MHIVLLCGGSGKRLWPLSNELRSKLFVEFLPSPGGGRESMISRVCRQLDRSRLLESTLIISHKDQANMTARHTEGRIPVIREPFKRGTFTAAALATLYLQSCRMAAADDIICIAPADVFADDDFFSSFKLLPDILQEAHAELALLGSRPADASEQYGYILPGERACNSCYAPVDQFIEKPSGINAESLLKRNALWNCGVYAFSMAFMLSHIEKAGLPAHYDELITRYEQLPERTFDKQVAETSRAVVLPYHGLWKDIGSWQALSAHLDSNVLGHGRISGHSPDSHIVNELPYPIHVIGVPGIIAAASPDGILIADKKNANEIKEQLGILPLQPMYVEATWGSYRTIDRSAGDHSTTVIILNMTILSGKHIGLRKHRSGRKAWTVLAGSGQVFINGQVKQVTAGDQFTINWRGLYSIRAETRMVILETRIGGTEGEESILFEDEDWGEIVKCAESI